MLKWYKLGENVQLNQDWILYLFLISQYESGLSVVVWVAKLELH